MDNSEIRQMIQEVESEVSRVIYGQRIPVRLLAGALLIGGHVLLEGAPGIGKTLLARTFSRVLNRSFRRIQFTPDLMPSDVTGVNVFDRQQSNFRFVPGPLFADIVLADEINRTPPKTQSALLEAMEERAVTVDGEQRSLGAFFMVVATQNPIEHEGTFPLPEAQLDRFLYRILMGYPEEEDEQSMLRAFSGAEPPAAEAATVLDLSPERLAALRRAVRAVEIAPPVADYIYRLIQATRTHPRLLLGASPRAGLNLALASKVEAALEGRSYVVPDDVKAMIRPVLNHRLILNPEMFDLKNSSDIVIDEVLARVVPPERVE